MRFNNVAARSAALLAFAALACAASLRPAAADETLRAWSLTASGSDGVALHIKYERRSGGSSRIYSSVHTVALSALRGLGAGDVSGPPGRHRFEMGHDAGKLVFDGTVGDGRGSGTYDVEPDPSFQRELARRGIRPATNDELLEMALSDFKLATLDAALASGFERPTPAELLDAGNHGITADYLRGFKDVPLTPKTLRGLSTLRDHGVNGDYVRGFADAGYRPISVDDLTLARDHGVDAKQAAAIHAAMPSLTMKGLALLRDHGVRPALVRALGDARLRSMTDRDIAMLSDHGVAPSLIEAANATSYRAISAADLAMLSDHGVPGDYLTGLDRLGLRASVADVVRLRDNGVSVAYVQRLRDHGYAHLSPDDIIKLAQHGI